MAKALKKEIAVRIHPELVKEVAKKKRVLKTKVVVKKKPKVISKRMKLISAKEADSVIDQIRIAFSTSAIGSIVGIILGASIPLTTFMIAHNEVKEFWSFYTALVAGGLLFSAKNVFQWTKAAFRDTYKALGFVLLIEGAMILSKIEWINFMGLGILIAINAIASGANLVIKPAVAPKKPSWV